MLRKKRFLIGGIIVFLAIGYMGFIGFQKSATFYYEVNELMARGSTVSVENVRVDGKVVPGSVEQEAQGRILKFTISNVGGGKSLPVVYQGVVPDTFKVGVEVVVEGQLNSDGIFRAHTLMPKCPSKYAPKQ